MSADFGNNLSRHHANASWLGTVKDIRFKRTSTGTSCVVSESITDWPGIEAKALARLFLSAQIPGD